MPRLGAASPPCPLVGRGLGYPSDSEGGHPGELVVETLLHLPAVHHVLDAWDGKRGFRHVGGYHAQPGASRRSPEYLQGQMDKGQTLPTAEKRQAGGLDGLQRDDNAYGIAGGTQE